MLDKDDRALLWYLTDDKKLKYFYIENSETKFTEWKTFSTEVFKRSWDGEAHYDMAFMDQNGSTKLIAYQEYATRPILEYPDNILVFNFIYGTGTLTLDSVIESKNLATKDSCLHGKSTPISLRIYDQEPGNPELRFSGLFTGDREGCYPYPTEKYSSLNSLTFDGSTPVIKELDSSWETDKVTYWNFAKIGRSYYSGTKIVSSSDESKCSGYFCMVDAKNPLYRRSLSVNDSNCRVIRTSYLADTSKSIARFN